MIRLIILTTGTRFWRLNGQLHRLNGPAIIHITGSVEYWINRRPVSEYEHMFLTKATYG